MEGSLWYSFPPLSSTLLPHLADDRWWHIPVSTLYLSASTQSGLRPTSRVQFWPGSMLHSQAAGGAHLLQRCREAQLPQGLPPPSGERLPQYFLQPSSRDAFSPVYAAESHETGNALVVLCMLLP